MATAPAETAPEMVRDALPHGWNSVPLGEVCRFRGGGSLRLTKSDYIDEGYAAFSASGQDGFVAEREHRGDAVVLSSIGARCGKTFLAAGEWTSLANTQLIFPDEKRIDVRYLWYFTNDERRWPRSGSAQPFIKPRDAKALSIPLPPLKVQRGIVARIDELFSELDDGEEELRRARAELETYRKSLLKAAVTGDLTEDWRAANPAQETGADLLQRTLTDRRARWEADPKNKGKRYKEPVALQEDGLPELPTGWVWASLDQIISEVERSFQSGPFGSELRHSEFQESGKLVIGIDNVRDGFFSPGSDNRISEEKFQKLARFRARPGDVLITVMATIGRTCVLPKEIEEGIITKHVYRMTMNASAVSPYFIEAALRGHPRTLAHIFGKVQGQTRPGLNKGILERTPVPVGPLEEQHLAIARADEFMRAHGDLDQAIERIEVSAMRQAILAAAFGGGLVQ